MPITISELTERVAKADKHRVPAIVNDCEQALDSFHADSSPANWHALDRCIEMLRGQGLLPESLEWLKKLRTQFPDELFKQELPEAVLIANADLAAIRQAAAIPTKRKRRRATLRDQVPLTPKQLEAFQLVADHKGNRAAAGREAGKSATAIEDLYQKALKKLAAAGATIPKNKALPTDSRGQVDVADPTGQTPPKGRVNKKRPTP